MILQELLGGRCCSFNDDSTVKLGDSPSLSSPRIDDGEGWGKDGSVRVVRANIPSDLIIIFADRGGVKSGPITPEEVLEV